VPGIHVFSGARVDGEDVIGNREIQNAVDQERRGFYDRVAHATLRADAFDAVHPIDFEQVNVARVDLLEFAVTPPRIISVVSRPGVSRRIEQLERFRIESLRVGRACDEGERKDES
jgi:hypothetical protein